jgi:hypothetical protein
LSSSAAIACWLRWLCASFNAVSAPKSAAILSRDSALR